ncbi:MAG TPA: ABC transporter ATP-binding protein [Cytophagales bacterium]|nr:ABC transporter ATP-binding protein [Cytophagales bacterium]
MSELVLRAIIRLFAIVAKEDTVTQTERETIKKFLLEQLTEKRVPAYLELFDKCIHEFNGLTADQEPTIIHQICSEINDQLTSRQKVVIMLQLVDIIMADGSITAREEKLARRIGEQFSLTNNDIDLIKRYVSAREPEECADENILLINSQTKAPGKHLFRQQLDGFIANLYLKSSDTYFFKYIGNTDVYLNGVAQRSGAINVLANGSALRWEQADPVYFGDVMGQFLKKDDRKRTSFEAIDISYQFKNGKLGLRNINLAEESGRLVAIMGASGAGKSTLLNILNGSQKPTDGRVLINGIDLHQQPEHVEGVIGFVPQDDLLMEDLTVYENLYYAARLCFNHLNEEEIDFLVLKTLDDLGLTEIRDLKVGSPLKKTISGGQRKRLNIGLELLREPAVLFVDEPTSGLSSRDSENIIDLLKELAMKGKLVFAVIHQPSSDIFKMFDKLLILDTGGYQIYYGNPVEAITYFKRSINLINSEQGECIACGNVNPEQIFNIIETRVINEFGNFGIQRKYPPEHWRNLFEQQYKPQPIHPSNDKPNSNLNLPGRLQQAWLFASRDVKAKLANTQYLVINLLEAPLLAFLLAFTVRYYHRDSTHQSYVFFDNPNLPAYLFMAVIVALFMGLTVSAEEIIRDRKILKREAFLHLSRGSYLFSKITVLFVLSAIQTLLFAVIGNSILGIQGMTLTYWLILFASSCFANILGLNISSAFNSAVTIYIVIPVLLIPQLLLSGVVVKFDKLNPSLSNPTSVPLVGDMMASRWAFEALMVAQFKDNEFERQVYEFDKVMSQADYKMVYYLPTLESKLDYVRINHPRQEPEVRENVSAALALLRHELSEEAAAAQVPETLQKKMELLTTESYDSSVHQEARSFVRVLRKLYGNRHNAAQTKKSQTVQHLIDKLGSREAYDQYRYKHQNQSITDLVSNTGDLIRIAETDNTLVQKIYPIYQDPDPNHLVDFKAQFYVPSKHFLNTNISTPWFNVLVVGGMIYLGIVALYFDWLRKLLEGGDRLISR